MRVSSSSPTRRSSSAAVSPVVGSIRMSSGPVRAEREPALGAIELRRRHAEVDQEAVDRNHPQPFQHRRAPPRSARAPASPGRRNVCSAAPAVASAAGSRSSPIEPAVRRRPLEDRRRVSARAQRGVAVPAARLRVQPGDRLVQHDRQVPAGAAVTRIGNRVPGRRGHGRGLHSFPSRPRSSFRTQLSAVISIR